MSEQNNAGNSLTHKMELQIPYIICAEIQKKSFFTKKNTAGRREYIKNLLKRDKKSGRMSMFDPRDQLTGSR